VVIAPGRGIGVLDMNMNNPALALAAPSGSFVIESEKGVKALIEAFAWHLLDGAWNPVPPFEGELTPGEVRKYFSQAALAAEETRGDDAPCVWVKSPYAGSIEITWESRGTHGRWVQLKRSHKGTWSLLWESGTGRESQFIYQQFAEALLTAVPELDWTGEHKLHPTEQYQ
jgi:hypothetical protein